ncbi:MAG: hypothetical protein DDT23_00031 [candidate division WS2 bacterium]|nr:hypothetical protein [Candidatus Lithacetigena glycinireducens]
MNENDLAVKITLLEGKKISINVAQVKELLKIILLELALMEESELLNLLRKHRERFIKFIEEEG